MLGERSGAGYLSSPNLRLELHMHSVIGEVQCARSRFVDQPTCNQSGAIGMHTFYISINASGQLTNPKWARSSERLKQAPAIRIQCAQQILTTRESEPR